MIRPIRRMGRPARSGFTLMELMLVMVILATLAAIVLPNLINKGKIARIAATKTQIDGIKNALANFDMNAGRLPTQAEGLVALVRRPEGWRIIQHHFSATPAAPPI